MTSIHIARPSIRTLFSARRIILVDQSLRQLISSDIQALFEVIAFKDWIIGPQNGDTVPLRDTGLPTNVAFVLERKGGAFGKTLSSMMAASGHPAIAPLLLVSGMDIWSGAAKRRLTNIVAEALIADTATEARRVKSLEGEVASLRDEVERRSLRIGRLAGMLNMLNLADEELAIDIFAGADLGPVSLPVTQPIGRTLHGLSQISVFKNSNGPARISVDIMMAGRTAYATVIDAEAGARWLDIVLPEAVIASVQNAQISFQSLAEDVTLAGSAGDRSVALRFWWERNGAEALPGPVATLFAAPEPTRLKSNGGETSHTLLRGLLVPSGATLQLPGVAASTAGALDCVAFLVPHGSAVTAQISRAAFDGGSVLALNGGRQAFELQTAHGAGAGRYDVIIAARGSRSRGASGITWAQPRMLMGDAILPRAFASAKFASLYSAISYCDGPLEELRLNGELGFAIVSASDGHPYLQTHPVSGKIVGARLADIVPVGTERLWIDIANVHPKADTIEFIAAVLPRTQEQGVEAWIGALALPEYTDYSILDLDDGGCIARVSMAPGTSRTLDIQLKHPLDGQGQLYCLVNGIGASSRFGWCRWNSIALSLDANRPPGRSVSL